MMLLLILGILLLIYISYKFLTKDFNYWEKKGVKYAKPLPLVGNMLPTLIQKCTSAELITELYNQFPNERYSGIFQFNTPVLLLKDPELIKSLTIKNFNNFTDHVGFVKLDVDPLWGKNLFASEGDRWRQLRQTLSPVFTTSKMKTMFGLMEECADQLTIYFTKQNQDLIEVEMKDIFTRYTTDVIASTAFGINCNSLKDRENEFLLSGRKLTDVSGLKKLSFLLNGNFPILAKFLDMKIVDTSVGNFFKGIINETIAVREKKQIVRPDLINHLMMARKGKLRHDETSVLPDTGFATVQEFNFDNNTNSKDEFLTNDDITAQALIFFFGGFDTSSTMMCFTSYELALNPGIQNRLRNEIMEVSQKHGDDRFSYEHLAEMKYLDMIISESLRKWSQALWIDRKCTKAFVIEAENEGEKPVEINVGETCAIPIWAIHRNPEFYPDPEKFDPERFSDENKSKINSSTYLPFGSGPRNCIGSRFALLQAKIVLVHLLKEFELVPIAKTQIPLKLSKSTFTLNAEDGFHLGLQRIK